MKSLIQNKNTFRTLLVFALPVILSYLLTQTYNLADVIIAGKAIGDDALSATGVTSTFIQFLSSIFWGYGVAVATISGEQFGANEKEKLISTIKTVTFFISIVMTVLCACCAIFAEPILTLLKVDSAIFESAKQYFQIFMIGLFFQSISYQFTCILQSLGISKFPLIATFISGALNVGLNLIFVKVLNWGVNGLAWATVISSFISLVLHLIRIGMIVKELGGNFKFHISGSLLKKTTLLAIPCILQQCSLYLSSVIVQPFINGLGKDYSAAFSIAMNVGLIFNATFHSVSRVIAAYSSQSKGAKQYKNYSKGILIGIALQVIFTAPLCIATAIWPNQIFSIFLNGKNPNILVYATQYVVLCVPFIIFCAYGNLMHSFFKAVESVKTILITTTVYTIARITFTYTIPNDDKLLSVYLGLSLAWVVESIVLAIF